MKISEMFGNVVERFNSIQNVAALFSFAPAADNAALRNTDGQTQAIRAMTARVAAQQEETFAERVAHLTRTATPASKALTTSIELEFVAPPARMTDLAYDVAYAKAALKRVGLTDVTDKEAARFIYEYAKATDGKGEFGVAWNAATMREFQQNGGRQALTSSYYLDIARAGADDIQKTRATQRMMSAEIRTAINRESDLVMLDFYKTHYNGVANNLNFATKLLGLPELPKAEIQSRYFNTEGRKEAAELGASIGAGLSITKLGVIGDAVQGAESLTALREAVTGRNARTGVELTTAQRVVSGAGGTLGAVAQRGRAVQAQEIVEEGASATRQTVRDAVETMKLPPTSGLRPAVASVNHAPTTKISKNELEDLLHAPIEIRAQSRINLRKGDGSRGSGIEYAWRRHGGSGTPNKSQFSISRQELEALLQRKDVVAAPVSKDPLSGNYVREVDVGKIIGNLPLQKGGQPTSVMTIITDEPGNVVNVFPGSLKFQAQIP